MELALGAKYDDFEAFSKALQRYAQAQQAVYTTVSSKTVLQANSRIKSGMVWPHRLKYTSLILGCKHFGKSESKSKGERPFQQTFKSQCSAFIKVVADKCHNVLVVRTLNAAHNHQVSAGLFKRYPESRRATRVKGPAKVSPPHTCDTDLRLLGPTSDLARLGDAVDLEPSRSAAGSDTDSISLPISAVSAVHSSSLPISAVSAVNAPQIQRRKSKPVCRLCRKAAGTSQQMVLIFKDVHASESLVDKIHAVTGLVMVEGDGLPLQICQPCFKRINDWFSYKQLCYSSDTKFRALAAAMETEPPGPSLELDAKQQKQATSTETSAETRAAEESPEVETRLIRVKEEVQEYPSEQLDSEECSGNHTLPFENVNVKLESEELRQFATTIANVEDIESFEEPTIKLEICENDINTLCGDPLASETIESGTLSPEPLSRIVPSAPRVPLCPSSRPSAVPCGSLDQLSAPEVPGDAPAASRSVLSCGTNPLHPGDTTVLLPPTPETALRDLSDLKRQASHQLIPTATENPSKRLRTDLGLIADIAD